MQKGSEVLGYEAEALAIYDLMRFVKPPISTLCVGNAFGEAAMLLASGQKVCFSAFQTCHDRSFIGLLCTQQHDKEENVI